MSGDDLARAEAIFHAARALPANEREAYARAACADDAALLALVLELLSFDDLPHALDETPSAGLDARASLAEVLPDRVGRYRIRRRIGAGGMGTVYEAEQEEPRRTVALKVLRSAHASAELLVRFRREARVLGALQHPGIAQVYEAGTAALVVGGKAIAEVPFLALELVRGEHLIEAVESRALPLAARLELFARLCDALEHAHAQGIVHRDLKPANILVVEAGTTALEQRPVSLAPKVLDFGIARLLEEGSDPADSTLATRTGQVLGTLAYMSPEQARGASDAVDARADVWALGVILFELLAGRRPFELDGLGPAQAARRLSEDDPPRLSDRDARLRGDLEVIVGKALEKEPARRYAHAGQLAADVRRHLAHEPIRARPASASYVLGKYARRHRALVFTAATGVLALVGGLAFGLWREHDRRVESEAATTFLLDVLEAPSALVGKRDITLLEALERLEPQLGERFRDTPDLEMRLRNAFGQAYNSLQRFDRGRAMLARAGELAALAHGEQSREALAMRSELGAADSQTENVERATGELEQVWSAQRERFGANDPDTQRTRLRFADACRSLGHLEQARSVYRELLDAPESGAVIHPWAHLGLAEVLMELRAFDESDEHFDHALSALATILGPDHAHVIGAHHSLAVLRSYQERLDEAEELETRALEAAERVLGPESSLALQCLGSLATLRFQRGDFAQARELLSKSAERLEHALGPLHVDTLAARNNVGAACLRLKNYAAALAIYADIGEKARATHGVDGWQTWVYVAQEGQCLFLLGRFAEAEVKLREAHAGLERLLGPTDERTRGAAGFIARACAQLGQKDAAQEWWARARVGLEPSPVPGPK